MHPTLTLLKNNEYIEGYWASFRNDSTSIYPWPISASFEDNHEWFSNRIEFLSKLKLIEKELEEKENIRMENTYPHVLSFRGLATCRLCRNIKFIGHKEFVLRDPHEGTMITMRWPIGYRHYLKCHDVVPSSLFISLINSH